MARQHFVLLLALCLLLVNHAFAVPVFEQEQLAGEDEPTRAPASSEVCKGLPDGSLVPDPTSKTEFFECNNHLAFPIHCPPGLIFSDSAANKGCVEDPNAPKVNAPCTMASVFDCTGKQDGFYPDASDRTKFHECVHGCGADLQCPPTTVWDQTRLACPFDTAGTQPVTQATPPPVTVHQETQPPVTEPPVTQPPVTVHQEETTPTHWTPDPWTPELHTDPPVTVHQEETTPTHWTPDVWTPELHTEAPVTVPPVVTPPSDGGETTRGRHSDGGS